ncbi:unnamed protein product [Pseudo-nitzschia multistriata]|uniref:Transmembrane protein n=1 Tax=Pseudo-nitzschia multistriata TaxID=183589 RepID=A0A448YZW4_9STRA|nr:unnamed protein product [Pseudo-nitzschia multistriata]
MTNGYSHGLEQRKESKDSILELRGSCSCDDECYNRVAEDPSLASVPANQGSSTNPPLSMVGTMGDGRDDNTARFGSPIDFSARKRSHTGETRSIFLFVAALALLLTGSATTTIILLTSNRSSDGNVLPAQKYLEENMHSLLRVHKWFRGQRVRGTRVLQDVLDATDGNDSDPAGVPVNINVLNTNGTAPPSQNATDPPTIIVDELITLAPTPNPSVSHSPTLPMAESEPSAAPSTYLPTISFAPTISHSPTNYPSRTPTSAPTGPPSFAPSLQPSRSMAPSFLPTISHEPSISNAPSERIEPTMAPTERVDVIVETNITMILKNVPHNLTGNEPEIWQEVTSNHVENFYKTVSDEFATHWAFSTIDVNTTLVKQETVDESKGPETDGSGQTITENQSTPTTAPIAYNDTITLKITYNQTISATPNDTLAEQELADMDNLFIYPFSTDSFDYSVDLARALNWTTWIIVEAVDPGERDGPSAMTPSVNGLTVNQTIAISASIVMGAVVIVTFLLWDRSHKNDGRHVDGNAVDVSIHSSLEGKPAQVSERTSAFGMKWMVPLSKNGGQAHGGESDGSVYDDTTSTRSAPAHLRRAYIYKNASKRANLGSTDEEGPLANTSRHSGSGNNSRASSDNSPDDSPQQNDFNSSISSFRVPKQVPLSNRSTSERSIMSSATDRSVSNHGVPPVLPPIPPRSTFGPASSSFASTISTHDVARRYSGDHLNSNQPSLHFQRPTPGRQAGSYGRRISALSDDSIRDYSFATDGFVSDRDVHDYSSEEQLSPGYNDCPGESSPHYIPSIEPPSEAFTSPLHIPDEEGLSSAVGVGARARSPTSPVPTILGLEPESAILTPSQHGFAMTVQDIE